jgi:hypothetical protein
LDLKMFQEFYRTRRIYRIGRIIRIKQDGTGLAKSKSLYFLNPGHPKNPRNLVSV